MRCNFDYCLKTKCIWLENQIKHLNSFGIIGSDRSQYQYESVSACPWSKSVWYWKIWYQSLFFLFQSILLCQVSKGLNRRHIECWRVIWSFCLKILKSFHFLSDNLYCNVTCFLWLCYKMNDLNWFLIVMSVLIRRKAILKLCLCFNKCIYIDMHMIRLTRRCRKRQKISILPFPILSYEGLGEKCSITHLKYCMLYFNALILYLIYKKNILSTS